jgi:hypothetical protein
MVKKKIKFLDILSARIYNKLKWKAMEVYLKHVAAQKMKE